MSRPVLLFVLLVAVVAAVALASNGGDGGDLARLQAPAQEADGESGGETGGGGEAEREMAERAAAAKHVEIGDRVAYYQLTTTSGFLRSTLEVERAGGPSATVERGELQAAATRLEQIRPEDKGLRAVQRKLLPLVQEGLTEVRPKRTAVILRRLDKVNADLSRFLSRRPAQAVLVPD